MLRVIPPFFFNQQNSFTMILSMSKNMPWPTVEGKAIPTDFEGKICRGEKKHTFRFGERWKPGQKIHFYMGNPRNGGTPFNPPLEVADVWFLEYNQSNYKNHDLKQIISKVTEDEKKMAHPICNGVERFKFRVDAIQSATVHVFLWINDFEVFRCEFNQVTNQIHYLSPTGGGYVSSISFHEDDPLTLRNIAKNDGLNELEFLRWFVDSMKDVPSREASGQIVHWTSFRYISDTNATIIDSSPMIATELCIGCNEPITTHQWRAGDGMCETCDFNNSIGV